MKTIKIFLASSEELKDERNTMADLILHLNKLFKGRGLEFELEKWEYLDASMTGMRKQDEYNEVLKQCDICMVLFWRKFGSYTGEELDTAYQRMRQKEKPHKIYVFFKNPNSDEVTQELKDFIANYEQRFGGHFFCKFQNVDTMKLEFLLQLENYQKDLIGEKAIEVRNEHVYVDNEALIDLNNIPFAANNEGFLKMQSEIAELRDEIEKLQKELEKNKTALESAKEMLASDPENPGFRMFVDTAQSGVNNTEDKLQEKLDKKNKLEEDFDREQQNLFNTARRITEQRGLIISDRMARAIEAFESGDAKRADIILDEAEKDADQALADICIAKQVGLKSLEELILKASVKMANDSIPIDDRIADTQKIYEKAVKIAKEAGYDKRKYENLIEKYGDFLFEYGKYVEATNYRNELLNIRKNEYGIDSIEVAWALNKLGRILYLIDKQEEALSNLKEAERIAIHLENKDLICESEIYNNTGNILEDISKYDEAITYHKKALTIREDIYGKVSPEVARSLNNIGTVLSDMDRHNDSLDYHKRALEIKEKTLGIYHRSTAISYNNIGSQYSHLGNHAEAVKYRIMANKIFEKVLGTLHPDTIRTYYWVGDAYFRLEDFASSLEWTTKAAKQGYNEAQCDMGWFYKNGKGVEKNYLKAYEWYLKAAEKGNARAQFNVGYMCQYGQGVEIDYLKANEWYHKAAEQNNAGAQCNLGYMSQNGLGIERDYEAAIYWYTKSAEQGDAIALFNLGNIYENGIGVKQDYSKAIEWYQKAAKHDYKQTYNEIAWTYHLMGKYEEALPWADKAVALFPSNPNYIDTLATVYQGLGRYNEAMEHFELCLKLYKEKENSEGVNETEAKIAALKELMHQDNPRT
jgi:TPR repeat protein